MPVPKLSFFLAALGLAFFLEGLPYFAAPAAVRAYLRQIQRMSDGALRVIGFALMVLGLGVAYWALH